MKKKVEVLYVFGFVGVLFFMALLFFIMPHKTFSELENRTLQKAPELTIDNIISGKFTDDTENYITDHFPFRNRWLAVKSTTEALRLQQENNGIYKGKDGYLFEKVVTPKWDTIEKFIANTNEFAERHPDVHFTFLLAPTSATIYPEKLPSKAPAYDQAEMYVHMKNSLSGKITFVNSLHTLNRYKDEKIFYKTDHHWTTYGAYVAYVQYAEKLGWNPLSYNEFMIENVSDDFLGSYHTRGQFSKVETDTIQAFRPENDKFVSMFIADNDETLSTMYDESFLQKKDKYAFFQGGVHALLKIQSDFNQVEPDLEKLLVIKDSFAHSFIPFLTNHVAEIHVIDPRYYNGNIGEYMIENQITDVLFLFNMATINDLPITLK